MTMQPSKDAGRPSCLVMNPRNAEASAARREQLLAAFASLDVNDQAGLLELAETWAFRATSGANTESFAARGLFRRMYAAAGWEEAT